MTVFTANTPYVCNWTTDECCGTLNDADPALAQACVDAAAEILYGLSGRQFGVCERTIRPCREDCCDDCGMGLGLASLGGYPWVPFIEGGQWINVRCRSGCGDKCSCPEICEVELPGPVASIVEVRENGIILSSTEYRVDNHNLLVRLPAIEQLQGDFQVSFAGLDPTAVITTSLPADEIVNGVQLPGNSYGPDNFDLVRLIFRDIDCVEVTYTGPTDTAIATSRPAPAPNVAPDAWSWPEPGFVLAANTPISSSVLDDGSVVQGTLLVGTAVTSNPNPPPLSRNLTISSGTTLRFCPSQSVRKCWPTCQDMTAPDTQDGTWSVKYMRGKPLPIAGVKALSELACELCKACIGDSSCCLPKRVTQITRQGVSMTLLDPMTFLENGRTGLYLVDAWLQSVNPKALARRAGVYSPDYNPGRETTWP